MGFSQDLAAAVINHGEMVFQKVTSSSSGQPNVHYEGAQRMQLVSQTLVQWRAEKHQLAPIASVLTNIAETAIDRIKVWTYNYMKVFSSSYYALLANRIPHGELVSGSEARVRI